MEQRTATIPFDLETAKKINIGEIAGRIVTEKGRNRAEIVYEDNSSICPLLVVIHSISVSADWFSATGKAISSENRLLLEVPEYITFKDGEVLSNEDGSFIFILNIHGKYLTSFYASLAARTGLNISDNLAACNNKIECYRLATDSEKQRMIKALKKSKNPKAKEYLKRFFGIEEKPKYEFKPFDKVLVRKEGNKKWNIKNEKEVVYPDCGVPIFVIKDIGVGFRKIEDATEVVNLLVRSRAFKVGSKYLNRSYERLNVINEGVVPAVEGCVGYTNEEFERVNKENNDPESAKIGSFNKTVEEANNIRSRVLKYVDKIKQERAYNIDLCMTFERYIEIADKDAERAMAFLKEAYPFNEETEVFIRKRYNMSIGVNPEEN